MVHQVISKRKSGNVLMLLAPVMAEAIANSLSATAEAQQPEAQQPKAQQAEDEQAEVQTPQKTLEQERQILEQVKTQKVRFDNAEKEYRQADLIMTELATHAQNLLGEVQENQESLTEQWVGEMTNNIESLPLPKLDAALSQISSQDDQELAKQLNAAVEAGVQEMKENADKIEAGTSVAITEDQVRQYCREAVQQFSDWIIASHLLTPIDREMQHSQQALARIEAGKVRLESIEKYTEEQIQKLEQQIAGESLPASEDAPVPASEDAPVPAPEGVEDKEAAADAVANAAPAPKDAPIPAPEGVEDTE